MPLRTPLLQLARALRAARIAPGDEVVVAFSGGADSLALLALLQRLPPRVRPAVEAVHVDHGLRPGSAAEAARVVALARGMGVEARSVPVRVEGRGGVEAAARRARYRALAAAAAGRPVLTAHSSDDQAETVLLRLARGAGLRGAAGIRPATWLDGARVLRPLLGLRRAALRRVVDELRLEPVEDPSNREVRFARNRVRAEVLPALERLAPGVVPALARFATLAAADARYLEKRSGGALARLQAEDGSLDADALRRLPLALRRRVVRDLLAARGGRLPASARVDEVLRLLPSGGALHLPGGLLVQVAAGRLQAGPGPTGREAAAVPAPAPFAVPLVAGGSVEVPGWRLEAAGPLPAPAGEVPPDELWVERPGPWLVRNVRRGERLPVPGTGHRRASDLLGEAQVPRATRTQVPLVEASGRPIWLVGVRPLASRPAPGATAWCLRASRR